MRIRIRNGVFALAATIALAIAAFTPALAQTEPMASGSCTGAASSNMAQPNGLSYTDGLSGCSGYQRYDYPGWSGSYGYIDGTPTWRNTDLNFFGPAGTTHVSSSHNLCTSTYGSCNGYIPTAS